MKKQFKVALAAASMTAVAANAHAAAMLDLTAAATSVTTELTPAISAAIPIGATILAVGIGWKMFRKFVK